MKLPPFKLVIGIKEWQECLEHLQVEPRLAIDLEANSMFAYRESVCLIQISIPNQDYIIDPTFDFDLSGLGDLIGDPAVEKIFHAAEYDLILLKRQYGWELENLFDTMWAARILGYNRFGLANLLEDIFQIKLNKRYQRSNWCKRPLVPEQLAYAQHDTHFLFNLRDHLEQELRAKDCMEEAAETFAEQAQIKLSDNGFDADSFWSINGVRDLNKQQQAVLKALNIFRDQEARRRNQPLFKIINDRTLLALAKQMPGNNHELAKVHGMTQGQIRRYSRQLLRVIREAQRAPYPTYPAHKNKRHPEAVISRYEKLRQWRKRQALRRGVESDVIVSRDALWEIAQVNPKNNDELHRLESIGAWRCKAYGDDILRVLNNSASP
jgi:ribonuclease D